MSFQKTNWMIVLIICLLIFSVQALPIYADHGGCHGEDCDDSGFDEEGHLHGVYVVDNALRNHDGIGVRSGPGADYTVVAVLTEDDIVTAIGRNEYPEDFKCQRQVDDNGNLDEAIAEENLTAWLQIEMVEGYFNGWVNLCMVQFDEGDDIPLEIVEAECPVMKEDDVAFFQEVPREPQGEYWAHIGSETARLRSFYNGCAKQLGRIRQGQIVEILDFHTEDGQEWVQVKYQNQIGWLVFEDVNFNLNHAEILR